MPFVDLNLTYSQQYCDIATGAIFGGLGVIGIITRWLLFALAFYVAYKVTKTLTDRFNFERKIKTLEIQIKKLERRRK